MPELFPDFGSFLLSALVMACAQFIYATVGFGGGMFSVALLAFVLRDFSGTIAVLMLLTFVTEVWVVAHSWRHADRRLLVALLPTMAIGLWAGTQVLVAGNAAVLKHLLGWVIAAAGVWFLVSHRGDAGPGKPVATNDSGAAPPATSGRWWWAVPVGLVSGVLGGLFGTGGPPVIILFRSLRLTKAAFRATMLWYFLVMSLVRAPAYIDNGILTKDVVRAAGWLLPGSIVGMLAGGLAHRRIEERHFAQTVAVLLVVLGLLLALRGGR